MHSGFGGGDGVNATPGTYNKSFFQRANGSYTGHRTGFIDEYRGNLHDEMGCTPAQLLVPDQNAAYSKCLHKLYNQVRDRDVDLGVDIGERHELLPITRVLRHPISSLAKAGKELAREVVRAKSKGNSPKRYAKHMSSAWLSWKLGVEPLVREIEGLYNYRLTQPNQDEMTFKARASLQEAGSPRLVIAGITRNSRQQTSTRCELSITVVCRNPNYRDLSRLMSLSPISLAWELTTLSFVVDWFFDVGSFLADAETALMSGLEFVRGWKTFTSLATCRDTFTVDGPFGPYTSMTLYGEAYQEVKTSSRSRLNGMPFPSLPVFKAPFSLGSDRILTAAGLLANAAHIGRK